MIRARYWILGVATLAVGCGGATGDGVCTDGPTTGCVFSWTGADEGQLTCVASYVQVSPITWEVDIPVPADPSSSRWARATFDFPSALTPGDYGLSDMSSGSVHINVDGVSTWEAACGPDTASTGTIDLVISSVEGYEAHGTLSAELPPASGGSSTAPVAFCGYF